ncbi:MAG: DUF4065 domain-containing protein [Clostridiales bacterium]|nr:DUF4065 domain-containing protein [Clostridiales bacterium]
MNTNMKEKYFCENCRAENEYVIEKREMSGDIRGERYSFRGSEAVCKVCGEPVWIPEIEDANLKAVYDVYREKNDIISLDKVRSIPEKYEIGKRPLSLLLGWGEHTLSRYIDGDVPSRQYSDVLKQIADDPNCYSELLERNKDKLQSEQTYRNSKKAVENLMGIEGGKTEKIDLTVGYILNRCQDITPLALQKVLYYIQGFFYAFYGEFLFCDDCRAWVHGPVYRRIYARYADYRFDPIAPVEEFDDSVFTTRERAVIDSVIKYFSCYSGKILEQFTHSESPWLAARGDIPCGQPSDRIIEKSLIGEYFCEVKEKYEMVTPGDIQTYAVRMFSRL